MDVIKDTDGIITRQDSLYEDSQEKFQSVLNTTDIHISLEQLYYLWYSKHSSKRSSEPSHIFWMDPVSVVLSGLPWEAGREIENLPAQTFQIPENTSQEQSTQTQSIKKTDLSPKANPYGHIILSPTNSVTFHMTNMYTAPTMCQRIQARTWQARLLILTEYAVWEDLPHWMRLNLEMCQ